MANLVEHEHLRLALDAAGMRTWSWEIATGLVSWSPGIEELVGLPAGAFGGSFEAYQRVLHPDDLPRVLGAISRAVEDPRASYEIEHRVLLPSGKIRWLMCRGQVLRDQAGAPLRMLGMVWDIDARKQAEARLAQLNRISAVTTAINQQIVRVENEASLFSSACRIAVELGGFRFAWIALMQGADEPVRAVASAGAAEGYLGRVNLVLSGGVVPRGPTTLAIRDGQHATCDDVAAEAEKHGRIGWRAAALDSSFLSIGSFPLRRAGKVIGALSIYAGAPRCFDAEEVKVLDGLALDISFALDKLADQEKRRVAESALRASEERYRTLVEQAHDAIFLAEPSLRFIDSNSAGLKLVGYSREELLQMRVPDLFDPQHQHEMPIRRVPVEPGHTWSVERRIRTKAGEAIDVEVNGKVLPDGKQQAFMRDIRERKSMQAELLRSDRLAALGRLAAGVAHEINNPLAYVSLNHELLESALRELPATDALEPVRRSLSEAREGAERVRQIVRGLSAFGRGDDGPATAVDLHRALDAACNLAENKIRHRARLSKNYAAKSWVSGNELRLGQVFVNLLVNAADAIPEGKVDDHQIRIETALGADGRVCITVSDSGAGIEPRLLERVFDPFFTTKPIGAGTGLGLSVCHNIIKSLGGEITVESELGRGTTFRVFLAAAEPAAQPQIVTTARPRSQSGRVLVVDDERSITRVVAKVLAAHQVTIAEGGVQARALCARELYDCILCDVMMPDLSGPELYEALRQDGRGLERKIVFMTGGAFAPSARAFLSTVPNKCLEKPFEIEELDALVSSVMRELQES